MKVVKLLYCYFDHCILYLRTFSIIVILLREVLRDGPDVGRLPQARSVPVVQGGCVLEESVDACGVCLRE